VRPGLTRGDGGNAAQLNEKHGVVLSLVCQSKPHFKRQKSSEKEG